MPTEMPKSSPEGQKQRQLDREIRRMISTLTSRLTDFHQLNKPGSSDPLRDEDEHGFRVITLAGTNTGATMRGEVLGHHRKLDDQGESLDDQPEGIGETYVNSNCQAVNNSIMLGSNYTSNDPGVHMDITDVVEPLSTRPGKSGGRGLGKGKGLAQASNNPDSEFTE